MLKEANWILGFVFILKFRQILSLSQKIRNEKTFPECWPFQFFRLLVSTLTYNPSVLHC